MRADWEKFDKAVSSAGRDMKYSGHRPLPSSLPLARSTEYGSSLNFEIELRTLHRHLLVNTREVLPLMPADVPLATVTQPGPCRCEGKTDAEDYDPELSVRYCPICHASTADRILDQQVRLAGIPQADPPPPPDPSSTRLSRRQRRKARV